MSKIHNYSAGPCILPQEVLKEAAEAVVEFNGIGLSLIEISHRSKDFVAVMEEAQSLVKELLGVPKGYYVLFLQGGASLGFLFAALNMARENKKAAYLDTGTWASGAIKEAKIAGLDVNVVGSSKDNGYRNIPKNYTVPNDVDYVHFTSNNTIYGTQFKDFPKTSRPLVCDMSSDIFSKKINVADFDLIYAGAQKNMGPAGTTVFIVKEEILGKSSLTVPTYLNFETHVKKESMFNTPPVFAVYVSMLTLRWLKKNGGVSWIEDINNQKANLLYNEIDRNGLLVGYAEKEDRSNMNATFNLTNEALNDELNKLLKEANISGLKGHRSVGGFRASMYNALPLESVQVLVDVLKEFETKFG